MKLSDNKIKSLKAKNSPYKLADGAGLYLYITPKGSKSWRFKYRFQGKQNCICLGLYPDISLATARQKHREARECLAQGQSPALAKKQLKILAEKSHQNTFEQVAIRWHEQKKASLSPKYAQLVLRNLQADIFPHLGKVPIDQIKTPFLVSVLQGVQKRGATDVAHRILGYCKNIFDFARIHGLLEHNPALGISQALKKKGGGHFHALEPKDIPIFLKDLHGNQARLYRTTYLAVKLLMLTFVRPGELISAKWDEIDFDRSLWVIPASKMKMKRDHVVPLSKQSLQILHELRRNHPNSIWVFPSISGHQKHLSNNTILHALWAMGYKGKMTAHGFRALAMTTILETFEYGFDVVDRQLAHAPKSKVAAAYDRSKFLNERTSLMQDWADYLDRQSLQSAAE